MKTIQQYLLDKNYIGEQFVYVPKDAEVVGIQDTSAGLILITIIDPNETITELRTFRICTTSEKIYSDKIKYIGSFTGDLGISYVVEILERLL